jgi:hypothetical protein
MTVGVEGSPTARIDAWDRLDVPVFERCGSRSGGTIAINAAKRTETAAL